MQQMDDWRRSSDEESDQDDLRDSAKQVRRNVATIATRFELHQVADAAWERERTHTHVPISYAAGTSDGVTGRKEIFPDPTLVEFGRYLKRARGLSQLSQRRLAELSGLSQSTISRLERGIAPSVGIDRIVVLGRALRRALPLGTCPHEHDCPWQPLPQLPTKASRVEAFVALMLSPHADPTPTQDAQADW
jgi:transcriptional regulator with XRE-family HTH domain